MTQPLSPLFSGQLTPGIYRLDMSQRAGALCNQVEERGWRCFLLDGSAVFDKHSFLSASAHAMHFPAYYGHNWDAFEECITDLSWLPAAGYVLLYDHAVAFAAQHPQEWATAFAILDSTVAYWQQQGRPFFVLLRNAGRIAQTAPPLALP